MTRTQVKQPEDRSDRELKNWGEIGKITVLIIAAISCLAVALVLIFVSYNTGVANPQAVSPREALFKDILTFVFSIIASIIIGYWFARLTNIEKVDTIAERSTEKMVLLSFQMDDVKKYLEDTDDLARLESKYSAASVIQAYRHRTQAAARLIGSLTYSNEAFRSDWLGVVSNRMRKNIERKYEKLRQYFDVREKQASDEKGRSKKDLLDPEAARIEAEETANQIRKDLTAPHPIPTFKPKPVLVQVNQNPMPSASDSLQEGELVISLKRDFFSVQGSGKLAPKMCSIPFVKVEVIKSPEPHDRSKWHYHVGVGTTFDFHIKIVSQLRDRHLLPGDYVFKYQAVAPKPGDGKPAVAATENLSNSSKNGSGPLDGHVSTG